jgi:drug/metabolite transporter (DMT)-like permease
MLGIVTALTASLSYGASDFLAGSQTRRTSLWTVILFGQLSGLILMVLVVLVRGQAVPDQVLLPAVSAGMATVVATLAAYRALAIGVMSIISPIIGLCAAVPVLVGLASGERPSMVQSAGIGIALGGLMLASRVKSAGKHHQATSRLSIVLAVVAALAYGFMTVFYAQGADSDPYWSVLIGKATTMSVFALAFVVMRPGLKFTRAAAAPILAIGVFAVVGNALFSVASTLGYLSIVSVLSSLAPVVVIALAHVFLHESLSRTQQAGIASALVGVTLIAVG